MAVSGHASLTLRANAVELVLPDLAYNGSSSTVPAGDKLWAPAPLVEGALGVYRGMSAMDCSPWTCWARRSCFPTDQIDNLTVDPDARKIGGIALGLGYGARVGLLSESGPLPGGVGQRHAARHSPDHLR